MATKYIREEKQFDAPMKQTKQYYITHGEATIRQYVFVLIQICIWSIKITHSCKNNSSLIRQDRKIPIDAQLVASQNHKEQIRIISNTKS